MKKVKKRLTLSKHVVSNLDNNTLKNIEGGTLWILCFWETNGQTECNRTCAGQHTCGGESCGQTCPADDCLRSLNTNTCNLVPIGGGQ